MRPSLAARVFVVLDAIVVAFQLALVAGAPWGALTMGGAVTGPLPPRLRATAAVSAGILALFGLVVAARARLALPRWHAASRRLIWIVVAYMLVGIVLNAITPSRWERILWLPVTTALAFSALTVARDRDRDRDRDRGSG